MTALRSDIDPDGLLEYSVVYTDRALNHMSARFVGAMRDLLGVLRSTYGAHGVAVVPGSGTFGMEAVARQYAHGQHCLVVRNGFFSYRWSQILQAGGITDDVTVLTARPIGPGRTAPWQPAPVAEVMAAIADTRPALVFAPHVETASGMMLPDDYLRAIAEATHQVGGLFVLDCIASGAMWVDMPAVGVDLLISAPQKGWSGTPCGAFVMFSEAARARLAQTRSSSFALDLATWLALCDGYAEGRFAYHATMPTDALAHNAAVLTETAGRGLETLRSRQLELGARVRALLAGRGLPSVAAPGFEAPGVVVVYTDDPELSSGRRFVAAGLQAAAGVPLQCGEGPDFATVRLGLFGLDKLDDIDGCVRRLEDALDRMGMTP